MKVDSTDRLAFGLFEVDLQSGELWKGSMRIKLPRQPFRVLAFLLSRPGEVVTRDQLQKELWGANTNVDFDQAIAAAINKIREALGDSAENPRFIQTLTRRGYRFIAPVAPVNTGSSATNAFQPAAAMPTPVIVRSPYVADPVEVRESEGDQNATHRLKHDPVPYTATAVSTTTTIAAATVPTPLSAPMAPSGSDASTAVPIRSVRHGSLWVFVGGVLLALFLGALAGRRFLPVAHDRTPFRIDQITHRVPISIGPPNPESFLAMAIDGNRVLTSVLVGGVPTLSAIDLDTGDMQRVDVPDEIAANSLSSISRSGSRLLLRAQQSTESEQSLWIVPSSGGSGRQIPGVLAHDAVWMPDDSTILYSSGNKLFLVGPNEDSTQEYLQLPGRAFWLRWSPDGKVLRFTLVDPTTHASSLWEMDALTRAIRPVHLPGLASVFTCCGVWTPDGKDYVFQGGDELYRLKGSGREGNVEQLTNGPLRSLSPVASPSSHRIFFVGLESPSGLEHYDTSAKEFRPAPSFLSNANRVDYSMDGKWVAWADVNEKLWRARVDGSDKIRLTPDNLEVFLAHWSPDSKHLAVMAKRAGGVWQIYLMEANGAKTELLVNEARNAADPGWSSDGRSVVFGREPDLMGKETGPHDLQLIDIASHKVQKVPNSDDLFSPRWSPDGRWIVALTLDQRSLRIYDVALQQWRTLASIDASDPVWSSDSRAIYIHAFRSDRDPILRIAVPTGDVKVVADLRGFRDGGTTNYFFGGVTPAGEPLVQPRIGNGNLYALDFAK